MSVDIVRVKEIGFCYGVQRAIDMLEKSAHEHGSVETLGEVVHNEQVLQRLNSLGIKVIHKPDETKSQFVAISSHGVSPQVETELRSSHSNIIDTTCPSVKRAQLAAQSMAEDGFWVIVFGDSQHPEVKGILGWAGKKGLATLDTKPLIALKKIPHRIGILSQTTQIPEKFSQFVKEVIDLVLHDGIEIRIVDTICLGVRNRQLESAQLAHEVDLMLVIGGRSSANTKRLFDICAAATETHLISDEKDIREEWLKDKKRIGITSGTSTSEETIQHMIAYLESLIN